MIDFDFDLFNLILSSMETLGQYEIQRICQELFR